MMTKRKKHLFKVKEYMEIRKNRKGILRIIAVIILFGILEVLCAVFVNYPRIQAILQNRKGNYHNYEISDFESYKITDCDNKKNYLEVTGDNPELVMKDVSGYIDRINISVDAAAITAKTIKITYDTGDGFEKSNSIEKKVVQKKLIFKIRKNVKSVKITFDDFKYHSPDTNIIAFSHISVNPIDINGYYEMIKNYIMNKVILVVILYPILILASIKSEISIGEYLFLGAFLVVLRIQSGGDYTHGISDFANVVQILFQILITVFVILLIIRKDEKNEKYKA